MRYKNETFVVLVVLSLIFLISLVSVSLRAKSFRRKFQNEVSARFDLEEKLMKMEERQALMTAELKSVRAELTKDKQEYLRLKSQLDAEAQHESQVKKSQ